jgi:peptidoglycan/xylan/chitin deacetylase (PgdA/CDA1 family)
MSSSEQHSSPRRSTFWSRTPAPQTLETTIRIARRASATTSAKSRPSLPDGLRRIALRSRIVPGPAPDIADRRAQLRRRRLGALGAAVGGLVALTLTLAVATGRGGRPSRRALGPGPSLSLGATRPAHPKAQTDARGEVARLLHLGLPVYCGGPHGHELAFTFDDGPGVYTHYALKKLRQAGERATFFIVGRNIDPWPGYLQRELRVGAVEDHTYTHVALTALSPSQITHQLQATAEQIHAITGEHVQFWRPPYELHNLTVDRIAQHLGLVDILWDDDSQDSLGASQAAIINNVEAGLRPGAIIEMHENRGQTIRALTTLLPELHRRHLRSVTIAQLLATDPPSLAQLRRGLSGCAHEGEALSSRTE